MTTERPIRWQDKPVTRGNIVRAAGLSVVAFGLVAAAKGALNTAETHALRGPHWSAEWQIVPAKNALDIPWQKFKGHDEWLRLSDRIHYVGVMAASRAAVDEQTAALPASEHAVAWLRNRETIEVGRLIARSVDAVPHYPDDYVIGMGVNRGDLYATLGVWQEEIKQFTPAETVRSLGQAATYRLADEHPGVVWV